MTERGQGLETLVPRSSANEFETLVPVPEEVARGRLEGRSSAHRKGYRINQGREGSRDGLA